MFSYFTVAKGTNSRIAGKTLQQDTKATMKCLNLIIMLLAYDEILALPMEHVHAFLLYVTRTHTISPFSTLI